MKILRWLLSIGIGFLFGWLTFKDGHFSTLFSSDPALIDGVLISGREAPTAAIPITAKMQPLDAGWQISLLHFFGYLCALSVIHVLRAFRWEPLIRGQLGEPISLSRLNAISAVGFMAIFLLPLRLGEFVRPYLLNREFEDSSMTSLVGSVALERIADGLVVTLFLFISLGTTSMQYPDSSGIRLGALLSFFIFSGGMGALISLYFFRRATLRLVGWALTPLPKAVSIKVSDLVERFASGLASLPDWRAMLSFTWMTVLYWTINGLAIWAVAPGFGISIELATGFMMMSCVVVGMMIPNSPANVGTFWYFLLLPLTAMPALEGSSQITILGLSLYLAQLIQQTAFGLWFIGRGAFTKDALQKAAGYQEDK